MAEERRILLHRLGSLKLVAYSGVASEWLIKRSVDTVYRDLGRCNDFVRFCLGQRQIRTDRNVVTFVNIKDLVSVNYL